MEHSDKHRRKYIYIYTCSYTYVFIHTHTHTRIHKLKTNLCAMLEDNNEGNEHGSPYTKGESILCVRLRICVKWRDTAHRLGRPDMPNFILS
jgi:hypothetical protein